eukprot:TRINITY_DN706_c0_g1_i1.p1 TRINITY_DN706_c0_g1~~TRINITY_DN706_c0_g1_i1.p1  ORF type:complete len:506 (+),score=88.66 TRINITY_DN706_c0_g1_i1:144-1661(+)
MSNIRSSRRLFSNEKVVLVHPLNQKDKDDYAYVGESYRDFGNDSYYNSTLIVEEDIFDDNNDTDYENIESVSFKKKKKNVIFSFVQTESFISNLYFILWVLVFGSFASSISFWIPTYYIPQNNLVTGINLTSLLQNCIGSLIIGICTSFTRVKFQYLQTYTMYSGIEGGFCSIFTTFGNVVADTGRLLLVGVWYLSLINLALNLILSIITYQIGRYISRKWKRQVSFIGSIQRLENPESRMQYELDKQLKQKDVDDFFYLRSEKSKNQIQVYASGRLQPLSDLNQHMVDQFEKSKRHNTLKLTTRHKLILYLCSLPFFVNCVVIIILAMSTEIRSNMPSWFPNINDPHLTYDWFITVFLSLSGALVGGFFGGDGYNLTSTVQWGTFKVNMISCILIGCTHNVVMFRSYLHINNYWISIFLYRFVTCFCGSESSWAGLINETMILWNGKTTKRRFNSFRNIIYNLFLCLVVFFLVVLSVRVAAFFRYWSPSTFKYYICNGGFFFSC